MESIGNDVFDLNATDPVRSVTPRFYQKFLTEPELALFQPCALTCHQWIWLTWSVKEAAYKCLQRLQPELCFSPVRFTICRVEGTLIALQFKDQTLYARSVITDNFIHSIVLLHDDFSHVRSDVQRIHAQTPDQQSAAVRELLGADIIKDRFGIPSLLINDQQLPVSLSHHSHWIAYAYQSSPYINV